MVFRSSLTGTSWPPSMIDSFLHPYHYHHALIGAPFFGHPWPSQHYHQERQVLQEPSSTKEQDQEKPSGEISFDNNPQHFSMAIDCRHFLPREVDVSIDQDTIVVHAHHQERGDRHGFIEREFRRRIILPPDVDVHQVSAAWTEDCQLLITAPKKPPRPDIHDKNDHSKRTIEIDDLGHEEPPQRPREREDIAKQVAIIGKTPAQQLAEADRLAPEVARQVKPEKKTEEEYDDRHRVLLTTQRSGQKQDTSMSKELSSELPPQELQLLDHLDARPSTAIGHEHFIAEDVDVPMNELYELPTGKTEHPTRYYPAADNGANQYNRG